jgi:hypothetical protein
MKLIIINHVPDYYTHGYSLKEAGLVALFSHSDKNMLYSDFDGYINNLFLFIK